MAKYSRRRPSAASGDHSGSPPPAYTPYPNHEQTPLLDRAARVRPDESESQQGSSLDQKLVLIVTYVLTFFLSCAAAVLCLAALFLFGSFVYKILLRILSAVFSHGPPPDPLPTYSVAIIGAGPAGISAAQYLHFKAGDRLKVTLFEAGPSIGGQLALNDSTGRPVFPFDDRTQDPITAEDIAGTALMWGNPLYTKTSEDILGEGVGFTELPGRRVGYFDGERIVSQTTHPYQETPLSSWLGLIWQYGASIWRAGAMSKEGDLRDRFNDPPLVSDIRQLMSSLGVADPAQEHA
ncbi:hypothetical protein GGR52DRAFT_355381 [Hypoxylon sp. FL1284]|nr:hypothetical protein GGR52DRAFT_355381 [Hypoxylon sp. FL1284]